MQQNVKEDEMSCSATSVKNGNIRKVQNYLDDIFAKPNLYASYVCLVCICQALSFQPIYELELIEMLKVNINIVKPIDGINYCMTKKSL